MTALNLGINSDSINYEVALEALGQARQPLMEQIRLERLNARPCQAFIDYCEARLEAVDHLQAELETYDLAIVAKILNGELRFAA